MVAQLVGVYDGSQAPQVPLRTSYRNVYTRSGLGNLSLSDSLAGASLENNMSTYSLIPSSPEYVSLSDYITSTQPAEYMAVSGLEGLGDYFTASKTMWALLLVAAGAAGLFYWKMRKAGIPVMPLFGLDDFGHSGRTMYGVFPKHRGHGHHRRATGRFHFHR